LATLPLLLVGAASPGDVELSIAGQRSAKGVMQVCLTRDADRFPNCKDDRLAIRRTVPAADRSILFEGLPSGNYAVALFHDENRNGKLDTMLGIPREGFGFSRNPAIGFGPPKFSTARFPVTSGEVSERVKVKYLL
jgi:uncharacterized protein (DUF2141 family)